MPSSRLPDRRALTDFFRRTRSLTPVIPDNTVCPKIGADDDAAVAKLVEADPLASSSDAFPGLAIDPDAIVIGSIVLAGSVHRQEVDPDRRDRMRSVIELKLEQLRKALGLDDVGPYRVLCAFCESWTLAQKLTLLIELAALDPFAPHELTWADDHRNAGLAAIAEAIGLDVNDAERVLDAYVDAARAHREISVMRIGLYTAIGAAAVGGAGLLAAPMIGAALGGAAGLGGAAATSHGLALIGGMAGTSSVTAGTWLVAQAGAVAGAVGAGAGSALFQLGAAQAQAELIKLQVAAKVVLIDLQRNDRAAHRVATELRVRLVELEARIEAELTFNDPDSPRVENLRRNAQSLEDASSWVDGHCRDDDGALELDLRAFGTDVDAFVQHLDAQSVLVGLDEEDRRAIEREVRSGFKVKAELDGIDVAFAIAAGVVAAVVDAFGTSTPKPSPVTTRLRALALSNDNWLSNVSKVPFDQSIGDGFTPNNHRGFTPGHDPLLGVIWGTWDILRATMTRTTAEGMIVVSDQVDLAQARTVAHALLVEVGHLLSDVATPAGLPLPGWTALTMSDRTVEPAVDAYVRGYDSWHLPALVLPVASISVLVPAYRHMRASCDAQFAATVASPRGAHRLRAIELVAFGVSAAADIAQLMFGASPLTTNYVQWLTLARRVVVEMRARSASVTTSLVADLDAYQTSANRGWNVLVQTSGS